MFKCLQIMCVKYYEFRYMFIKQLRLVKIGAFAWYSAKIRVIFIKKANLDKNKNMQTLF